jgi:hypothetical protein
VHEICIDLQIRIIETAVQHVSSESLKNTKRYDLKQKRIRPLLMIKCFYYYYYYYYYYFSKCSEHELVPSTDSVFNQNKTELF